MNQKAITLIISSLQGGGAERVCVAIANGLVTNGWEVDLVVLTLKYSKFHEALDPNINVYNLNQNHARSSFYKIHQYLKKNRPVKILVFNHQIAVLLVLLNYLLSWKIYIISRNISNLTQKIIYEPSVWHKYIVSFFVKILYKHVNKIIAQSNGMRDDLINNFKINPEKVIVINNPISPHIENAMRNINLAKVEKRHEIVFVGRLHYVKGLNFLLKAFKIINQNDHLLKLRIIGDGPMKDELVKMAEDNNILEHVIFEGFQKNIAEYFLHGKLTILTSLYEGFPNVLIESIAMGTPVVSFDCPSGPREIIQNGVNGYLVRYKDVNDLVDKILISLKKDWDPKIIQETSNKFSSSKIISEYEKEIIDV